MIYKEKLKFKLIIRQYTVPLLVISRPVIVAIDSLFLEWFLLLTYLHSSTFLCRWSGYTKNNRNLIVVIESVVDTNFLRVAELFLLELLFPNELPEHTELFLTFRHEIEPKFLSLLEKTRVFIKSCLRNFDPLGCLICK